MATTRKPAARPLRRWRSVGACYTRTGLFESAKYPFDRRQGCGAVPNRRPRRRV